MASASSLIKKKVQVRFLHLPDEYWSKIMDEQKDSIITMTTEELESHGLIEYEKEEDYKKRIAKPFHDKFILESLRRNGILKQLESNPMYKITLKGKVLAQIDKKEWVLASEILVRELKKYYYFYTTRDDNKTETWIYQDGIYIPQGKSFIKEFIREVMGDNYRERVVNDVIGKIEADTFINARDFFNINYPEEIPLKNGILNIITRDLKPFTPEKIFFNKLPITYEPKADCPYVKQHLYSVLRDESDINVIFEIFGYCLLKEYRFERSFMWVGTGRNGKGKTMELLKRFLGAENCSGIPLSAMQYNNFCISELFGKMANLAGDISHTDLKDVSLFKSLCGRDMIQAGRKYLNDLYFTNYSKLIFACNLLPKVYDTSDGFWDRWVLIEFPYKFVPESVYNRLTEEDKKKHRIMNPDIMKYLSSDEEMSGLLNRALDSLDKLISTGNFSYSKGTSEIKDMWIRQADSFMAFCMDNIIGEFDGFITKRMLRKRYHEFCQKHKVGGCSDKAIHATLQSLYGATEDRKLIQEEREQIYTGIKFKWEISNENK